MSEGSPFSVTLRFHGDLPFFLRNKSVAQLVRVLREKTSVKDVIESCGVPHPEADVVLYDGMPTGFSYQLIGSAFVDVYPVASSPDIHSAHRLQRRHLTRFVVDGHLGKLARDLRLLGFDTAYESRADDLLLVRVAVEQERALLTRDRRLLMHAVIRDGYCPRSHIPDEQTLEVVRRFELAPAMQPFARCLRCNAALESVEKQTVIAQLEPLTKTYYADFRRCRGCGQVYWSGSHFAKLERRIAQLRAQLDSA